MMRTATLLILLFSLLAAPGRAQRVGVVLSGGGAKGLYHVGVLKALEESGVPVDCISGTSMGSIVGGLYAIGYSPDEIAGVFRSEQIRYWLTGEIPPQYRYYFKQMERRPSMISIRLDFHDKVRVARMPSGLVPAGQLDMAFVDFFAAPTAACGGDFDRLFVPYRCVATDAAGRREVIFSRGDLGRAIRASMSIPLLFPPIKADSAVLYDGGMFNNFPWQVLEKDFAPDVIIGSKCVDGNRQKDGKSLMDRLFDLTMLHTDYTLPADKGILIDRSLDDISMLDFDKADRIIRAGYEDAMQQMPAILAKVGRRVCSDSVALRRADFRSKCPPLTIERFDIGGLNSRQRDYVRRTLRLDRQHELPTIYGFNRLRNEYYKLLSEGELVAEYPNVCYDSLSGLFSLGLKLHTKPSFRLLIGGNVSSTALNQAYLGLEYRRIGHSAQTYNLDAYLSPFYLSGVVKWRADFFLRVPFYAEAGGVVNYYNYFRSNYGFLSRDNDLTYAKYGDSYLMAVLGAPLGRRSVMNVTVQGGYDRYRYFQQPGYDDADTLDQTRFRFVGVKIGIERDNLNYVMYPNRGLQQSISAIYVNGRERYLPGSNGHDLGHRETVGNRYWFGVRFRREQYFPVRRVKWFSLGWLADAVLTTHPDMGNEYATNITSPAFTPTPHSKIVYMKEFRSNSYLGAGIMPCLEITQGFYCKLSAYMFLPSNYDGVQEGIRQRLRYIFDASVVYQTIVGPVSLSVSKYDVRRNNWFITFNFGYAIFNRKGLFY